jgi:hypothetical protein
METTKRIKLHLGFIARCVTWLMQALRLCYSERAIWLDLPRQDTRKSQ